MLSRFLPLLFSFLICSPALGQETTEKKRVAVLKFSGVGISSQVLESTTESAREGALDMLPPDKFLLMTKENTLQVLKDMGENVDCITDGACEAETLRKLQADYGVTGNIRKLDGKYELTLSLFAASDSTLLAIKKGEYNTPREMKTAAKQNAKLLVANIPEAGLGSSVSITNAIVRKSEVYKGEDIVNVPTGKSGFLVISSEPKGAAIFVNGKSIGQAPLQKDFPEGKYVVLADMGAIYHPATAEVNIKDGDTHTLNLELKPSYGHLVVNSEPSGAKVYVSGEYVGDTPYENKRLPSDIYNLRVEKDKYFSYEERIIIEDEKTTTKEASLLRAVSNLHVKSTPSKAEIWLNGLPTGELTPHIFKDKPPGQYEIRLVKDQHKPLDSIVMLEAGKDLTYNPNLGSNFGHLRVETTPSNAKIILNGKDTGKMTPATLNNLNAGINILEIKKDGYGVAKERIEIPDDGSTLKITKDLAAKLGTLMLTSTLPSGDPCVGGDIYINGQKQAEKTPHKLSLVATQQKIVVDCNGMKGTETLSLKHNETTKLNISVQAFSLTDITREQQRLQRNYIIDGGLASIVLISAIQANSNYNAMQSSLDEAAAITNPKAGQTYTELISAAETSMNSANRSIVVASITTGILVAHYIWKTRKHQQQLREMEKVREEAA